MTTGFTTQFDRREREDKLNGGIMAKDEDMKDA
eukprot:CAMPEP_0113566292 /NCGR_PEP_ID=MMETSP0015_2-20120614/22644_1 /TAXON_ID=2838 /ORGANISM="Odontella" /LENGTH=32 /DNA_ID=CAMNT_0000468569 /DNA_START=120 /DNA_END=214 /DNA_ORIENTATION=- /assembly_acc=CAM_ASM_000160